MELGLAFALLAFRSFQMMKVQSMVAKLLQQMKACKSIAVTLLALHQEVKKSKQEAAKLQLASEEVGLQMMKV